jgi:hypothetical protein
MNSQGSIRDLTEEGAHIYPSIGTNAATGDVCARPGDCTACLSFSCETTRAANVVLPEPGMPPTPIRRRWEGESVWYVSIYR